MFSVYCIRLLNYPTLTNKIKTNIVKKVARDKTPESQSSSQPPCSLEKSYHHSLHGSHGAVP